MENELYLSLTRTEREHPHNLYLERPVAWLQAPSQL